MTNKEHQLEILPPAKTIELTSEGYMGYFQQYTLTSVFQPIFSFAHNSPIGYEALLRSTDINGQAIPPNVLFASIGNKTELLELEKTSRTIHILNFFREDTNNALLFLNITPRLISNCYPCLKQMFELLNDHNIPPTRIVIEFLEESDVDTEALIKVSNYLHQNGCLIAIDDFGAGHSNFNRVWDLRPDIVKLDKSIVQKVKQNSWFLHPIINLVELLHESESLVLIEGIEDKEDAELAHTLNVDLHQGYFLGYPLPLSSVNDKENYYLTNHNEIYPKQTSTRSDHILTEDLKFLFYQSATGTQATFNLSESCEGLLNHPNVMLCYLLNEKGYQIGTPVFGEHVLQNLNYRYGTLGNSEGVNWSRRIYFKRALSDLLVMQITRPYLSLTSGQLCITLSIAIKTENNKYVLCCDVKLS